MLWFSVYFTARSRAQGFWGFVWALRGLRTVRAERCSWALMDLVVGSRPDPRFPEFGKSLPT